MYKFELTESEIKKFEKWKKEMKKKILVFLVFAGIILAGGLSVNLASAEYIYYTDYYDHINNNCLHKKL